jgi:hypothetical protein
MDQEERKSVDSNISNPEIYIPEREGELGPMEVVPFAKKAKKTVRFNEFCRVFRTYTKAEYDRASEGYRVDTTIVPPSRCGILKNQSACGFPLEFDLPVNKKRPVGEIYSNNLAAFDMRENLTILEVTVQT